MTLALVAFAAALGAAARFVLDQAVSRRLGDAFPWGTFAVNVTGSFSLGVLVGLVALRAVDPAYLVVLGVGFLGAYTTFSTWMVETVRLIEAGSVGRALWNVLGSWAAGTAATVLGLWAATLGASGSG
jgi:fluoride exporter